MKDLVVKHPQSHLYVLRPGQSKPQATYLEYDPTTGVLRADWDGEIGGEPVAVRQGLVFRWALPTPDLTRDAIVDLMDEVAPLVARVGRGWSEGWDRRDSRVGLLDDDASDACEDIEATLREDPSDVERLAIYTADEWYSDPEADDRLRARLKTEGLLDTLEMEQDSIRTYDRTLVLGLKEYLRALEEADSEPVTDERIEALRAEAGEAGDLAQVAVCDRALAGNVMARVECARVIADSAARNDAGGDGPQVGLEV